MILTLNVFDRRAADGQTDERAIAIIARLYFMQSRANDGIGRSSDAVTRKPCYHKENRTMSL